MFYSKKCEVFTCGSYDIKAYSDMYYDCLGEEEYHYFCDEHACQLYCPIHADGRRWCEVASCNNYANTYTRTTYSCLKEGDYHFFCDFHSQFVNCQLHTAGFKR